MAILLWLILLAVVALLAYAATRPDTFRLERSTTINAPAEMIFPLINNFHEWRKWSPWENIDADLKRTYSGTESGIGAIYAWEGKKAGSGQMEIAQSVAPEHILINLDFIKPFKASNKAEFVLKPQPNGSTQVTWAMSGQRPFMMKLISIFFSMEKMVGPDFEKGLASMKHEAERS